MTKVSVIIPVYKTEKYLRPCLDSVINQTLKDIEIICINDGSPDNSIQILEEYASKDERIKIINKSNGGVSSARNAGLEVAQGEYIGFIDSDDYIDLNFYECLYNRAQITNSDIVVSEYICKFKDNTKKKEIFLKVDKDIVTSDTKEKLECLYSPAFNYVWNKIYKRTFLNEKFIENVNYEDIYFSTNVLTKDGKMSVAVDTVYNYRNNADSITNNFSMLNMYFYHKAISYFYNLLHENNINIDITKYHSIKKYKFLGITFLKVTKVYFRTTYKFLAFKKSLPEVL